MYIYAADRDFFKTLGIEMVEEIRDFQNLKRKDKRYYVLNQSAKEHIGWDKAVNKSFSIYNNGNYGEVVGVVSDFNMRSLHHQIGPSVIMTIDTVLDYYMHVRCVPGDFDAAKEVIKEKWKEYAPENAPLLISSMKEDIESLYNTEQKSKKVVIYFTVIAMIISLLGMLGMATYLTLQRTKEIGVRKVMGATAGSVIQLFLGQFLKWVVFAFVIASPLAYLYMHNWLQNFAYRIELGPAIFIVAALFSLFVGFISVIAQSFKAAQANPIDSLREE